MNGKCRINQGKSKMKIHCTESKNELQSKLTLPLRNHTTYWFTHNLEHLSGGSKINNQLTHQPLEAIRHTALHIHSEHFLWGPNSRHQLKA